MKKLDLNLLRVLDALMRKRSVTAAAQDLGLTQSSVSNGLNRLRIAFGDRVLERQGNIMVPTRLARDLWPEVAAGLTQIDAGLATLSAFAPATAITAFRIGMDDYALTVLGASLSQHIMRTAPGVHLDIPDSSTFLSAPSGNPRRSFWLHRCSRRSLSDWSARIIR